MTVGTVLPRGVCPRCTAPVMVLRTPTGLRIAVDPEPRVDGPLIVNGLAARIIGTQRPRPAGDPGLGWSAHDAVCPFPPSRCRGPSPEAVP